MPHGTIKTSFVAYARTTGGLSITDVANPHGELVAVTRTSRAHLSRKAKAGEAVRIAPGLYIVGATLTPEQAVRNHLHQIVANLWPGGVLCGRTAFAGGIPADGEMYVAHPSPPRQSPLSLPGVTVYPVVGPHALPGDVSMPCGLAMSGQARALVDNLDRVGRPARFRAGGEAVEHRIDELARAGGPGRIQTTLDQLDVIASHFDPAAVSAVRRLLAAVLGSFSDVRPVSERLRARLAVQPFDDHRIAMLSNLVDFLGERPPNLRHITPPPERWNWLPFFEAYFSNFIEGTEFGVDEARRIAVEGVVPDNRPADAHDVAATFRLATDPEDRQRVPRSGDELVGILCNRHRVLMAARAEKHPGELKQLHTFAGGYQFVEPALVEGTLKRGFDVLHQLHDPFFRALTMMVLVTEVHPFDDGNGRVARLTVNAELSAAGRVRIVIPTVFRNDYLVALNAVSGGVGRGESLLAVLDFAQQWVATVDWSSFDVADRTMVACNAYLDPVKADASGQRLVLLNR